MSIGKPNPYPGIIGQCPDYRVHQSKASHDVTVESGIVDWDGTILLVSCSCGKVILDENWKRSFDEINAAVTRHLALETDDYPGLKSIFAHTEEIWRRVQEVQGEQ